MATVLSLRTSLRVGGLWLGLLSGFSVVLDLFVIVIMRTDWARMAAEARQRALKQPAGVALAEMGTGSRDSLADAQGGGFDSDNDEDGGGGDSRMAEDVFGEKEV